ncbi:flagellar biosynthesis regulator FlaF [Kordiimonas marina]|uniref:flagellar biosynthesis regulator FlaF n=1 Tax=Kordiimonas marina TaxID=2872312 RepID=UPI001FF11BE7|nr:flagellar biosynthesis regulator FlaF [Kordiimonas marina]MCJ9430314.1 flagellar biosynthesis regulator FlaF [Kordiimonas marina]
MSYQAYQKAQQTSETPSQVEYRLFAQVTNALIAVRDRGIRDSVMVDALDWNRRLWSTLSTDCGTEGNSLPDQLRAGIISLSIWVSKHSSAVMRGTESVDDLININKTIMEGLAAQAKLQREAAQQQDPANTKPVDSSL